MRKILFLFLAALLLVPMSINAMASDKTEETIEAQSDDVTGRWRAMGPDGGVIYALVIDPSNTSIIYAGSTGSVFKSIDGGGQWSASSSGMPNYLVRSLAIDPSNTSILYAGTNGYGVFKSIDGGGQWSASSSGLPNNTDVNALAIDPSNTNIIYAGTMSSGVFKSTNGGGSWSASNNGLTDTHVCALSIDPSNTSIIYAGTFYGVYKSIDGGGHWNASGLTHEQVNVLSIDPSNTSIIYAAMACGVSKSTDGGGSWNPSESGLIDRCIYTLPIDPSNPSIIYAGIMGGAAGGVFKSIDGGGSWNPSNSGLTNTTVSALAIDPSNPSTIYTGTYYGVYKSIDGGGQWSASSSGLPNNSNVSALAIDPSNPSTIYTETQSGGVFKSISGGGSWSVINNGLTDHNVYALAIDPIYHPTIYAGTYSGVFKSTDGGGSWNPSNSGLTSTNVRALAIDPSNTSIVYAGTYGGGVFKSTNWGSNWVDRNNNLMNTNVRALAIDPSNTSIVYAGTYGGGVFKSTNSGIFWVAINNGLTNNKVYALAIDPSNHSIIYAGTYGGGVYMSTDGGGSWNAINSGLTNTYVDALAIDPSNHSIIYAGTDGGGAFKFLPIVSLSVSKSGTGDGSVTSNPSGIDCGSTCTGSYDQGTSVTLIATPSSGSNFVGWSGACSGTGDCVVTMDSDKTVTATFNSKPQYGLTVVKTGTGNGTVNSSPAGINCGSNCSGTYIQGTSVTLTAAASSGSVFAGWSGACSGTGDCVVMMDSSKSVTATFNSQPQNSLIVVKTGTGDGTVASSPAGINCGSDCSGTYIQGTSVTLTATPSSGSAFAGWAGACSGTGDCVVMMDSDKAVTATFEINTYTITVTGGAGGSITPGTVTVSYGSNQTFTVSANTYYHIADVQVDSASVLTPGTEDTFQYTFTNITANHQIAATFTLVNIAVTSPSNGQIWGLKSKQTIGWTYSGTPGKKVSIQLLKGGTLVKTISAGAKIGNGGSGSYSWKLPTKMTPGDDYQIRITSTTNSAYFDTSDGHFTIR